MEWDLRQTSAPKGDNGMFDIFFLGEIRHLDMHMDECHWDPEFMDFLDPAQGKASTNS